MEEDLKNLENEDFGVCTYCEEDIEFKRIKSNPVVKNVLIAWEVKKTLIQ